MNELVGVGIIGAGVISEQYLDNLVRMPGLSVLWVGDVDTERARARAARYGVPCHGTVAELLADPRVSVVVNLTVPQAHVDVGMQAVAAGKHVWSEKPFSMDRESGRLLLAAAERAGVRVACAPDTILGEASQAARRLVEGGAIGTPLTGLAIFQTVGPESWHPSPEFLYAAGGGPLFDIGPYYLASLLQVFGPVASVVATSSKALERRVIGSGPRAGTDFPVEVPTQVNALLRFESGANATVILSFESARTRAGVIEVTGTTGTVVFADPNEFAGRVEVYRPDVAEPEVTTTPDPGWSRGIGVAELIQAVREGRPERANGQQALHVVDLMASISEAAESGGVVEVGSTFTQAPALPVGWDPVAALEGSSGPR